MAFAVSYAFTVPFFQQEVSSRQQRNGVQKQEYRAETDTAKRARKPLWRIQRTQPISWSDLDSSALDLQTPPDLRQQVIYNDTLNGYFFGRKLGGTYLSAPIVMLPDEYMNWTGRQQRYAFFRKKNAEIFQAKGKDKFDFTDMHFDLGPAEKIFGPGGVHIRTQGTAELKFGATMKNVENPALTINRRHTTTMNFDEKLNVNVNGKVGDKVNMNLNYNTDATFDFDAQNLKLKYEGKEDEIVKLVEAGNISFPSNSSLIRGATSLFGLRTDLQFGKLKMQLVASQKKSSSKTVSSRGGVQLTPFEFSAANYEENRHFFLAQYFRDHYAEGMRALPNLKTGINIGRVEIWVTNKTGTTTNTRNIVALTDLGEHANVSNTHLWATTGMSVPSNRANTEYAAMAGTYNAARDINQTSTVLDGAGLTGGSDYEKLESARLLSTSEYTVNKALGYISLNAGINTDQVVAVAFEYTHGGQTYQVGEFAGDRTNVSEALFVKSLKNTSNSPSQGNWNLMMKNVYRLGDTVEKERFRLDVKYQSDTTGVYLSYIPEEQVKKQTIIKLLGADRLDNNNRPNSNGYFDYVEGYTVSNGRVFFPEPEPFGRDLYRLLVAKGVPSAVAQKYVFNELYDNTRTAAKQMAEKDKYNLVGQFRGSSANIISLGAYNIPQGSVVVTAGGVRLVEGSDYSVDYSAGEVTILNQSIIDAGTAVNVSLESNSDYGMQRKTMFGVNWEYDFSRNLQLSGTLQHLSEQSLTNKVTMGSEPLNNTLWGLNINWKKESQWLTDMLDKLPFLHLTQPSQISFTGEFAQLIAGRNSGTQDNASYLDDFENTTNKIDIAMPASWIISSVPSTFPESSDKTTLASGFNRSQLAWYTIDPLFTRRSSSLTPAHLKNDLEQLSNHYVREVATRELYPKKDISNYNGSSSTLNVFNLAYYPNERGPYNFNPNLNQDGTLPNPERHWGGLMRKLDTNDFERANIEYVEFWLLDPFIYSNRKANANDYGGDFYLNLGEVSEDVLHDGKKFYESGMPVDGSQSYTTTQWGKIPTSSIVSYAFATTKGARALQDVGFNGLNDEEERRFQSYQNFLTSIQGQVSAAVWDSIYNDPANDDYHYFRGSDYDQMKADILRRYKYINNPQGNSPDSGSSSERYDTSYKTTPDVEDINQDYTLNEYEKYYQYHVSIRPNDMVVGSNFIVDKRDASVKLRNGRTENVTWYQFRIPLREYERRVGSISDFTSIRFMRMFLTGFKHPIVLRFGSFDLVRGDWRVYERNLDNHTGSGTLAVSSVSIEENGDKTPVNYILPPGINREQDPTQPQLIESNEQALNFTVNNLSHGESKAVYKNTTVDLRQYKRLQMFVHANALEQNTTQLDDNQLAVFIRLGSDYKNNYYEYQIPLKLTPPGKYNLNSPTDRTVVWPQDNMMDIALHLFTDLKKQRNIAKAAGHANFMQAFTVYDKDHPANLITILGNPSLGEVKTMIIGVRNLSGDVKSGEVWVNELRLKEYNNKGGWAANGNLNVQLSDLGTVNVQGRYVSDGFGGLESTVAERTQESLSTYSVTTSLELGKFFPDKVKVSAPLYYSVSHETSRPRYNPLDTDMTLKDALESSSKAERDSIEAIAVTKRINTNFSLSNVRIGVQTKNHPMPYDPANFSFSYSHSHSHTSGKTTVYENEDNWRGAMNYNWSPVYRAWEPFKGIRSKSKWWDIVKKFGLNWLPQNLGFNTEMTRSYYELQERDMETLEPNRLPVSFNEQFLWNRDFTIRWDLTRNLHMNFQSATRSQIEEPYTPINKMLYADRYHAWKDSVWTSIKRLGTPLDYQQTFTLSYQVPLNLLPIFDWINADTQYNANYTWVRGTETEKHVSLGNTITNNRNLNLNGSFNMERLYNHIPFLKKTNERFNRRTVYNRQPSTKKKISKTDHTQQALPNNKGGFEQEITLRPDTVIAITHGKHSRRLIVSARTEDGHSFKLKFKKMDDNTLRITNKVDSAIKLKLTVNTKTPLEKESWYRTAQSLARIMMMLRSVDISYRNQYAMTLPGFMPNVGKAFGQSRGNGLLSPGLDFAFGVIGDSYIDKALERNWLLMNDSVATPAATTSTADLQLRATLEPFRDFKIDLNATRVSTKARSIQYMYAGRPTTQSGTFSMTTISLGSAFEGIGNANSGYHSKTFDRFCNLLDGFRQRVEAQYVGSRYPAGTSLAGQAFNPNNGTVSRYSADVMVPAFLSAYTSMSGKGLDIFPALTKLLPNWSVRYSGLVQLPWFRDVFRSFNINHGYRSIYTVGSYASFSSYQEYMNGLGFVVDATSGNPVPSSMFNVSMVSINEAFSPLLGIDMTFNSGMTAKLEYRTVRSLNLSMTSVQLNESLSRDWVMGIGYRINDFKLFGMQTRRKVKRTKKTAKETEMQAETMTKRSGVNHDLNLNLDFSYRRQASLTRDIATMTSNASSGNSALRLSFTADYTLSRMLTMSFFYDFQNNTPLLSSNSYPTSTRDFGLSMKFSLTR